MRSLKWLCLPLITSSLLTSAQAQPTFSNPGSLSKKSIAPAILENWELRHTSFDGLTGHFPSAGTSSPEQANKEIQESIQSFFREPDRKITLLGQPPRLHQPFDLRYCNFGPDINKPKTSGTSENLPVNIPTSICPGARIVNPPNPKAAPFRHLSKQDFFDSHYLTRPLGLAQGQFKVVDSRTLWEFGLRRKWSSESRSVPQESKL